MKEFKRPCCIQSYHVYQEERTAAVGEELVVCVVWVTFLTLVCSLCDLAIDQSNQQTPIKQLQLHMVTLSGLRLHAVSTCTWCLRVNFYDCKYFVALIIWCKTYFEYLIFGYYCVSENFPMTKLARTMVHLLACLCASTKIKPTECIRVPRTPLKISPIP